MIDQQVYRSPELYELKKSIVKEYWDSAAGRGGGTDRRRYLHLAYNFLRGMPYKRVESRTHEHNRLNVRHWWNNWTRITKVIQEFDSDGIADWATDDIIERWIRVGEPEEQVA